MKRHRLFMRKTIAAYAFNGDSAKAFVLYTLPPDAIMSVHIRKAAWFAGYMCGSGRGFISARLQDICLALD